MTTAAGVSEGSERTSMWAAWAVLTLFFAVYSPVLYYMALHWKIVPRLLARLPDRAAGHLLRLAAQAPAGTRSRSRGAGGGSCPWRSA